MHNIIQLVRRLIQEARSYHIQEVNSIMNEVNSNIQELRSIMQEVHT